MRILRKFLRKPSGFVGVCCLWGVVLVLFSFVATYHLSRHHPTDLLTDSEDPVELERQLRRRIEGLQGERAVLGDEPVAGRVNWLMQSMENMKETQGRMVSNITALLSKVRILEEENSRLRQGRLLVRPVNSLPDANKDATNSKVEAKQTGGKRNVVPKRKDKPAADGDCRGPFSDRFLHCEGKMKWMRNFWKSDPCYAENGVDGSDCSFQVYLSEVENWCPPLSSHQRKQGVQESDNQEMTSINTDLPPLLKILEHEKLEWVKTRITFMWPDWQKSANILATKANSSLVNKPVKKILLHLGLISDNAGFKIAETAFHGGPLGELVQWADLIASLYLIGHKVTVSFELQHIQGYFRYSKAAACPGPKTADEFDIVFIDIVGLRQFKKAVGAKFDQFKCRFRVLDSFGTEPEFNLVGYRRPGSSGDWGQAWGNWNLNLRQFWTMFPHSPDNSFLGFVVDHKGDIEGKMEKKMQSLVYGKELDMWKNSRAFLDIVHQYTEVHATIGTTKMGKADASLVPPYVTNHGVLDRNGIQQLLQETKVFIGLGFPFEGPAPLEALANGCFFLNPKFSPPLNRVNTPFFKQKPTLRALTSQHPYAELFVGKPHVYTIDIKDLNAVRQAMEEISKLTVSPHLPYEYTHMGLLERISAYASHQDFCNPEHQWPPLSALDIYIAKKGQSCKDACLDRGLVCEPEFFAAVNKEDVFKSLKVGCFSISSDRSIFMPSFEDDKWNCFLQSEPMLFSCVGEQSDRTRICPCRKYAKGQVALCTECR